VAVAGVGVRFPQRTAHPLIETEEEVVEEEGTEIGIEGETATEVVTEEVVIETGIGIGEEIETETEAGEAGATGERS
jgi:hypothetical protein